MYYEIIKLLRRSPFKVIGHWSNSMKEIKDSTDTKYSVQGTLFANKGHYFLTIYYNNKTIAFKHIKLNNTVYGYGTLCNSKYGQTLACIILSDIHLVRNPSIINGPLGESVICTYKVNHLELINTPELTNFVHNKMKIYLTNFSQFFINLLFMPSDDVDQNNNKHLNINKYLNRGIIDKFNLNKITNDTNQECVLYQDYRVNYSNDLKSGIFNYSDNYHIEFFNISLQECYKYRVQLIQWLSLLNGHNESDYKCIIYSGKLDTNTKMKDFINLMYFNNTNSNYLDDYSYFDQYPFENYKNIKLKIINNIFESLKAWLNQFNKISHVYNCLDLINVGDVSQQLQKVSVAGENINDYLLDNPVKKGTENKIKHAIKSIRKKDISKILIIILTLSLDLIHTQSFPKYLNMLLGNNEIVIKKLPISSKINIINNDIKSYRNMLINYVEKLYHWWLYDNTDIDKLYMKCQSYKKEINKDIKDLKLYLIRHKIQGKQIRHNLSINQKMFMHPISEYMYCLRTNLSHPQTNGEIIRLLSNKTQATLILVEFKMLIRLDLMINIHLKDYSIRLLFFNDINVLIHSLGSVVF